MAEKTFGSVVMGVVVDVFKQDPVNVDKSLSQYEQARRYVIDAMEEIRGWRFRYNAFSASFATTSATSYNLDTQTGKKVVEIDRVFYADSSGYLQPKGGIVPTTMDVLERNRSQFSGTSAYIEDVAVEPNSSGQDLLHISPPPDGTAFNLHVFGIYEPARFTYDLVETSWKYSVDGTQKADIDAETSIIFTHAGKLLRLLANANLYAGPLDDEKGKRQAKWRALAEKERARLEIEKQNMDNHGGVEAFI